MPSPNFLIIGAAKAGTTSLYYYLNQHPDVFMSPIKETNYFAFRTDGDLYDREIVFPVRTSDEYRQLFEGVGSEHAIGEASPLYLEYPHVAARIHQSLPEVRLLVILREPAERALSAYAMRWRKGWEHRDVQDAVTPGSHYVQNGLYCARLKPYFDLFPKEHMHVMLFDDLQNDSLPTVQSVFRFIGVDPGFAPETQQRHNIGGVPKSMMLNQVLYNKYLRNSLRPVVPARMRVFLRNLWRRNLAPAPDLRSLLTDSVLNSFQRDIHCLQTLIERDLSAWLERYRA
jgi:hypothetical protein